MRTEVENISGNEGDGANGEMDSEVRFVFSCFFDAVDGELETFRKRSQFAHMD